MANEATVERLREFAIPGLIMFDAGAGGLTRARITTPCSAVELYLHGAQVTAFSPRDQPPLLFLSQHSRFSSDKAIRGGVPICFPWFGPRNGDVAHGYARLSEWEIIQAVSDPPFGATLRLRLPKSSARSLWQSLHAEFTVSVTDRLSMELLVTNEGANAALEFEACLHTYLAVGDVNQISITGLGSTTYLDKLRNNSAQIQSNEPVTVAAQMDRTYLNTTSRVEVRDPVLQRTIRVEKDGSQSTVLWNPGTTQSLPDMGRDEYRKMMCVESGNVEGNRVTLDPGESSHLKIVLSGHPLT